MDTGPNLLNDSVEILLRFLVNKIAFCADIARAFLCVQVAKPDRDYMRFLWFQDDDPYGDVITLRYRCLTFGPTGDV